MPVSRPCFGSRDVPRLLLALTAGGAAFGVVFAVATSLPVAGISLSAGSAPIATCATGGITVTYTTGSDPVAGYTVTGATVANLSTACAGKQVRLTLADAASNSVAVAGPVTVPGGGGSVSLPIGGTIAVTSVADVHVAVG